ncbi:MAG: hypothetical protein RSD99_28260, partial [Janthinobacterium sp.]
MSRSLTGALAHNFLGQSPRWYKAVICLFLVLNPLLLLVAGPVVAGWLLVIEFIFTLGMALKCYPLMPGGLLLVEALLLEMTTPQALYEELLHNFPVILLLMF